MAARRGRPPHARGKLWLRLELYPGGLQALAIASGVSLATVYRIAGGRARKVAWEQLGLLAHAIARAEQRDARRLHRDLVCLMEHDLATPP